MNVIELCSNLVSFRSITPNDDGIAEYVANFLETRCGCSCTILEFQSENGVVKNLFASRGDNNKPSLGFIGHLDVVPPGDGWSSDPFCAVQRDGRMFGRGVCDMKGGVAAFCCALETFVKQASNDKCNIRIFLTGDEEIGSVAGMQSLLKWAEQNGQLPSACLVGEPTSIEVTGDRIYLGHRGSVNVNVVAMGKQNHVATAPASDNALSKLCCYISHLIQHDWRANSTRFPNTKLEPTLLFNNNYATNIIPDRASANINVRFSDDYTPEELQGIFNQYNNESLKLNFDFCGLPYYCDDKILPNILAKSIEQVTQCKPVFSGGGGTSDGRFMISHCPVIEFGLPDTTMHQKDESIAISDLQLLEKIYTCFISNYFHENYSK